MEINVRPTVFYPARPGINYITVRGFTLCHAATQWAPPTAEQVGLIGTHWSKGWIIENNVISDSRCSGVTLGKCGDQWDNKSANSAGGYVKTIERALANGWNKATIGHHIDRNNTIFNCEQTGICGSLGAVFSRITGNHIYDIYTKRQFGGYEMAGVKIHAAIDMLLANNRIHNAYYGIWLDWMAQGTRVSANLCYDNSDTDLLMEMNHGPFMADNNFLLSKVSIYDQSQGGAYAHNLIAGAIKSFPDGSRQTPYVQATRRRADPYRNYRGCFAWTTGGLVTYYLLFVMELATRRVHFAGCTPHPATSWMKQIARELTNFEDGFLNGKRYLLIDRDDKFCPAFQSLLEDEGVNPVLLPPRSPKLNAHVERFFGSLKSACLERMIYFGENMLRTAIRQFLEHYHAERNHQGLDNQVIAPGQDVGRGEGEVRCRERLGGLLRYYYRDAA